MRFSRNRKKRGQGGLEFIITYGWAILVVLISLAALVYFDVFSIGSTAPDKCILPIGIICLDSKISATEGITLSIANGMKKPLFDFNFTIGKCGTNVALSSDNILRESETEIYTINCTETLHATNLFRADVNISYMTGQNPVNRLMKRPSGVVSGTIGE